MVSRPMPSPAVLGVGGDGAREKTVKKIGTVEKTIGLTVQKDYNPEIV